jgi:hypothetical protein
MKRADLEHIIRAASAIAETEDTVILGSQAILGAVPAQAVGRCHVVTCQSRSMRRMTTTERRRYTERTPRETL